MNGKEVSRRVQRPGGGRREEGENIARVRKVAPERRKPTQTSGWRDTSHEGDNKDTPRYRSTKEKKRQSVRGRGSGKYEKKDKDGKRMIKEEQAEQNGETRAQ